jgi:heme exporter protein D
VVWWIVAGVTIVPLVVLVVAAALVGERLMELQRVADLTARQRSRD